MTLGTVVAGKLAEDPTRGLVWLLAICLVGAAVVDTFGKIAWVGCSDRAEGRLREDLLRAALRQPLSALSEQAVGEILDRIDDDSHEVGNLVRWQIWMLARTLFATLPMWVVAGLTWGPSFVLFPVLAGVTWLAIRSLLGEIARRKVVEEMAWTDHAAVLEEGIAGRDDLRTSLGQPHVVRRVARLSADVHAKFKAVVDVESRLVRRAGVLLHALLAGIAVAGVAFASGGSLSVAQLVTLFLVTSTFVGQIAMVANHLPDLQAGLGADCGRCSPSRPSPRAGARSRGASRPGAARPPLLLRRGHVRVAGHRPAGPCGPDRRPGRPHGLRQVDAGRARLARDGAATRDGLPRPHRRPGLGPPAPPAFGRGGHAAHGDPRRHPRGEHHALRRDPAQHGRGGGGGAGPGRLGRRSARRPRHPAGPGGTSLSAGEEQLVAFARLLVRDVRVVVLDEATARMDPLTERRWWRPTGCSRPGRASSSPTGCLPSSGPRWSPYSSAGASSSRAPAPSSPWGPGRSATCWRQAAPSTVTPFPRGRHRRQGRGRGRALRGGPHRRRGRRRSGPPPEIEDVGTGPSLACGIAHALAVRPAWGALGALLFLVASLAGAQGAVTGLLWGRVVEDLQRGGSPTWLTGAVVVSLLAAPVLLANAFWRYPWWVE